METSQKNVEVVVRFSVPELMGFIRESLGRDIPDPDYIYVDTRLVGDKKPFDQQVVVKLQISEVGY